MPDIITEFFNDDIPITDLGNGGKVTLLTTSASETAVIKDIALIPAAGLAGLSLDLEVNGTQIAVLTGSASGPELIGVSSELTIGAGNILHSDVEVTTYTGSGGTIYKFEIPTLGAASLPETENTISVPGSQSYSNRLTAVIDETETYLTLGYWDSNSTNDVKKYRLSDGVEIQDGINTSYGAQPAYGGDNYMYWCYNSTVYRMRTDDASGYESFVTSLSSAPNTTYPVFGTNSQPAPNNERCFISANTYNGGINMTIVDATTGSKIINGLSLGTCNSGFWTGAGGGQSVEPFYSVARESWMVAWCDASGNVSIGELTGSSGEPVFIAKAALPNSSAAVQLCVQDDRIFVLDKNNGSILEYNLELDLVSTLVSGNSGLINSAGYQRPVVKLSQPSAAEIASRDYGDTGSFRMRITGIKTTGIITEEAS